MSAFEEFALSFPVSANDVRETKELLKKAGSDASVVAKIERVESLADDIIDEILKESAGIMVARGVKTFALQKIMAW